MIQLIDRNIVFEKYNNITTVISEMQKAFYEEEYLEEFCKGEKERNDYLELFDAKQFSFPKLERTYLVISFDHDDIKTFTKVLSDNLKRLLTDIGIMKFIVIAHYKMEFVGNIDNKFPPLQKAFKKFKAITNNIDYSGAF